MQRQYNAVRAFTLIELIVVLVILAIVYAILFPVFARPRISRQSPCYSHLHEICTATLLYSQDYDEHSPPAITTALLPEGKLYTQQWAPSLADDGTTVIPGLLHPYFQSMLSRFKTADAEDTHYHCPSIKTPTSPVTYMYNDLAAGVWLGDVATPAHIVLFLDGDDVLWNVGHARVPNGEDPSAIPFHSRTGAMRFARTAAVTDAAVTRHNGYCVYGFADGHVKAMKPDSVFFPPRRSSSPGHRDPKSHALFGPDPRGDMSFQGYTYGATFHLY